MIYNTVNDQEMIGAVQDHRTKIHLPEVRREEKGEEVMTDVFRLRHRLIRRCLTLEWLIAQFNHRKLPYTSKDVQDVYCGVTVGAAAAPIIVKAMEILDDYDRWYAERS